MSARRPPVCLGDLLVELHVRAAVALGQAVSGSRRMRAICALLEEHGINVAEFRVDLHVRARPRRHRLRASRARVRPQLTQRDRDWLRRRGIRA